MNYPLYNLVDKEFEELIGVICHEVLGAGTIVFSDGKDGGRDGKFEGVSNNFPSNSSPWNGKFIIQAKHTTSPIASCSESEFSTILKKELYKIRKIKEEGKIDYYLVFTNRKLTGIQDPKIEDFLNENIGSSVTVENNVNLNNIINHFGSKITYDKDNKALIYLDQMSENDKEKFFNIKDVSNQEKDIITILYNLTQKKIESRILAIETIQQWLKIYPNISKNLGLNKLLFPLEFYEKDIQELVIKTSKIKKTKDIINKFKNDFKKISIEEKNKLNKLSDDYFKDHLKKSYNDFSIIKAFLEDPKNEEFKKMYENTISDIQEEIILFKDSYDKFDFIFNHLYKYILDNKNNELCRNRRLIRVYLHYMYANCDIGIKEK